MITLEEVKILSNEHLKEGFYILKFHAPEIAASAKPGQFVNIRMTEDTDPLLRRPISIYDADTKKGIVKILYFKKGKGTGILSEKKEGDTLSVTGPHGNGFHVHPETKSILLVGGGFGIAPLSFLAKLNPDKKICTVLGARSKALLLGEDEFKGCMLTVCTDDGTCGLKGNVVDGMKSLLSRGSHPLERGKDPFDQIFTVGPKVMMQAVAKLAEEKGIECQVSMEERMACGIGVCFGCVCKTKEGMKTVCTNGPVFKSTELEWN